MTTASGHTKAILASRVIGTNVYNEQSEKVGAISDIVLDKTSDRIMFAVMGFGGLLGMGERFCPIPWAKLDYQENAGGYVVGMTSDAMKKAPAYDIDDLTKQDAAAYRRSADYFA